jgi:hypothetical protein
MLLFLLQATAPPTKVWYTDPMIVATIVVAAATVVNLLVAIRMWRVASENTALTRDMFEAAHRPYIGVSKIKAENNPELRTFLITIDYKNVGSVPADEVHTSVQLLVNGFPLPMDELLHKKSVLMPDMHTQRKILIDDSDYKKLAGNPKLDLTFSADYKGIAKKTYSYKHETAYNWQQNVFMLISTTSTEKPPENR